MQNAECRMLIPPPLNPLPQGEGRLEEHSGEEGAISIPSPLRGEGQGGGGQWLTSTETGFTLIEVIVSLVLAGIVGAIAVMGVVSIVKGYVFTKINSKTAHKGQTAMVRIVKELNFISSVTTGTGTSITFQAYKNGTAGSHSISWTGTANDPLILDGDILTDRVSNFALSYRDTYNSAPQTIWTSTRKVIEFTLTIQGADNVNSSFTGRVVPRNL
ncbi:MAG: prepilin-type N-terminal cleavage/methylation domain-containing protein [Nitrospirae bacterium]|nr:prepilin-type N-terminal cleavage/methylation domain-containing protein [Nitrospirota bacterium]